MLSVRSLVLALAAIAAVAAGAMGEEPMKVAIDAHSHLNDATALINKNAVVHSQNAAVMRSNIRGQQDDDIMADIQEQEQAAADAAMDDGEQPRDVPAGLVLTGDRDVLKTGEAEEQATTDDEVIDSSAPVGLTLTGESSALMMPDDGEGETTTQHELRRVGGYRRRFFYPGFRGGYRGWRYPLPYWRRFGRRFYRGPCPFGRVYGGFFYC